MITNEKIEAFKDELNSFENENMRNFACECISTIPEYFFHVGASSSGKYHPLYSLGEGGLLRHTKALVRIFNHYMGMSMYKASFNSVERDACRIACIMHDSRKSGSEEEYAQSKYTKFEHPLLAAEVVRNINTLNVDDSIKQLIAETISSHMGEWNTNQKQPNIVLPVPTTKYQKIVHTVDYFASRKDLEVKFDGFEAADNRQQFLDNQNNVNANATYDTFVMPFGKYKGRLLKDAMLDDTDYFKWVIGNMTDLQDPLKSFIQEGINKRNAK